MRCVPIDRVPLPPLPADLVPGVVYMDYFGKLGGGTPTEPIPVTLPNDLDLPAGTQVELWHFDEAPDGSRPNQWAQYGTGTVSNDGSQIVPDIDPATGKQFGQPRFCCGINMAAIFETARQFWFGVGHRAQVRKRGVIRWISPQDSLPCRRATWFFQGCYRWPLRARTKPTGPPPVRLAVAPHTPHRLGCSWRAISE